MRPPVPPGPAEAYVAAAPAVRDLLDLLHPDAALEPLVNVPRGYMERYQAKVKDIERRLAETAKQLQQELADYRALLLAEHKASRRS